MASTLISTDTRKPRLDGLAVSLILICCVIWGLNQVIVKMTLPVVPPLMQGALRSAIAAVLVGLWARHRGITLLERDGVNRAGVIAGALFAFEFCCVYWGLQYTSASRAIVFLYLAPFIVALGMPFISTTERLRAAQIVGLCLAFGALAFAFRDGLVGMAAQPSRQWLGDCLSVIAAAFWGLTTLWIRATALASATPERTLFLQLAVSAPIMALASVLAGEPMPQLGSMLAWGSLGYQSVVIAFASYLTWFWLLRHYPATRVSAFTFLTPVLGLVAGVVLLGESISAPMLTGLFGVAAGLWLVNRR